MMIVAIIVAGIIFLIINFLLANSINRHMHPGPFYFIAIVILMTAGIIFIVEEKRKRNKEEERLMNERRTAWERENARQRQLAAEQQQIEDEAASRKLREHVNELLDYASLLGKDVESRKLLQAMHDCINRLGEQRDIQDRHFNNGMLRNDIDIIFKQLETAGMQNDMVTARMRVVLRRKESSP